MGIKQLNLFFKNHLTNPKCIQTIHTSTLKDKTIAIDTSIYLYKFMCAIKNTCVDIYSQDGIVISHIQAILNKVFGLLKLKIKPIFVFDGKSPEAKQDTMQKRSEKKSEAKSQLTSFRNRISEICRIMKTPPETSEDIMHYKRLFVELVEVRNNLKKALKKTVGFSTDQSDECKHLLKIMGIPYVTAISEADPQCSHLVKTEKAFAVASEDMDILTFGTKHLITGLGSKDTCKIYDLNLILADLKISYMQFVDICILLGCDYTCTIRGLGIKKILNEIKENVNIEGIIKSKKYIIPEDFDYKLARKMFTNPSTVETNYDWNVPNYLQLKVFLQTNYSYTEDEIGRISDVLKGGYYSVISGEKSIAQYQKDCSAFNRARNNIISFESDED